MATDSQGFDGKRQFSAPGVDVTMLAGADETDGVWSLFEYEAEAGFEGPPPHWHEEMVEGFYVLDGAVEFTIDGQSQTAGSGEYVHVSTHAVHAFEVTGDGPGRFLLQVAPGGFEGYFAELASLIAPEDRWPPEDMGPVTELMGRYDTFAPPVERAG